MKTNMRVFLGNRGFGQRNAGRHGTYSQEPDQQNARIERGRTR
jgi:hypothetical protein